jgi:tetratricopeptide (TPR) repeat protein
MPDAPKEKPAVFVPVSAEDAARKVLRKRLAIGGVAIVALAITGLIYKRSTDPIRAQQSYEDGARLFKVTRYDQAILALDHAISLNPKLTDAYLLRARSHLGSNNLPQAVRDLTTVVEQRPSDTQAVIERGTVYLQLKDPKSALADAERAIAIDPKLASAYNLQGLANRDLNNLEVALSCFSRAVELRPDADNYYQRGYIYQQLGRHREAIDDFTKVIEINRDMAASYFSRAESKRALGDLAGAKADHQAGRIIDGR